MSQYPQTPLELVQQAVVEAKRRGAAPGLVDPVPTLFQQGNLDSARACIDDAMRRNPDSVGNLRTKLSWAANWKAGRLPGTMQADAGVTNATADEVRDAWLHVISNGKYVPPTAEDYAKPDGEVKITIPDPGDSPDPPKAVADVINEQPNTGDQAEVKLTDDYSDIQDAINRGDL